MKITEIKSTRNWGQLLRNLHDILPHRQLSLNSRRIYKNPQFPRHFSLQVFMLIPLIYPPIKSHNKETDPMNFYNHIHQKKKKYFFELIMWIITFIFLTDCECVRQPFWILIIFLSFKKILLNAISEIKGKKNVCIINQHDTKKISFSLLSLSYPVYNNCHPSYIFF